MEQRLPPLSRLCVHPLSCILFLSSKHTKNSWEFTRCLYCIYLIGRKYLTGLAGSRQLGIAGGIWDGVLVCVAPEHILSVLKVFTGVWGLQNLKYSSSRNFSSIKWKYCFKALAFYKLVCLMGSLANRN